MARGRAGPAAEDFEGEPEAPAEPSEVLEAPEAAMEQPEKPEKLKGVFKKTQLGKWQQELWDAVEEFSRSLNLVV